MYDEGYYRYREQTRDFRLETDILINLLRIAPGCRVLELGCGGGALLARLEKEGCRPVGVDLLDDAVEAARKMAGGCEVVKADVSRLPFPDASFDRLVSQHLVEHLADLPAALSEWRRLLTPGGVMALCTPNRRYQNPGIFEDPGHVRLYDRRELADAVEKAGFGVERCLTVFPGLGPDRVSVKVGVPLYRLFQPLPYFRERGRTILISARKR